MSEKVILTKEQAEAIGFAKKHHMRHELIDAFMKVKDTKFTGNLKVLYELSYDKFFKALYIGYEVEPEFSCEVGDWIKDTSTGAVFQVKDTQHRNNVMDSRYTTKRHATPSEIAEEKGWRMSGRKRIESDLECEVCNSHSYYVLNENKVACTWCHTVYDDVEVNGDE